jgi:protein SCO1/2
MIGTRGGRSLFLAVALCASIAPARSDAAPPASAHCTHHSALAAAAPLPGQSLYNLRATLADQHGATLGLDAFRGHPVIVAMFYASCTTVCPLLIEQVKSIDAALPPELRAETRVLMVSLDPARDRPERLADLAASHGVRDPRWHLARSSESSVREIAALLGVRYRRMSDGSISHSPLIAVLDRDGVLIARSEGMADASRLSRALAASSR